MKKLSTGDPSTLGSYLKLCKALFGSESKATKFIEDKIKEARNGENEEVLADERQMLYALVTLANQD